MKKTDLAMIIFIAAVSVLIAYFVAKSIIGDANNKPVKVKTVDQISADVREPDPDIFNKNAINPTVEVIIGQSDSSQ